MTDPTPAPDAPQPDAQEAARIRRNKLVGRIIIVVFGLLILAQVSPMLLRMLQHRMP